MRTGTICIDFVLSVVGAEELFEYKLANIAIFPNDKKPTVAHFKLEHQAQWMLIVKPVVLAVSENSSFFLNS